MHNNNKNDIRSFFDSQVIFLTGATGFVGKVLLEKVLRECPKSQIYVLLRPKAGKTVEERFEQLFDYPCFDRIRGHLGDIKSRLVLIAGDCEKANLGLAPEDVVLLQNQVTCVIHAAANVKFNQSLRVAAGNVRAVRDILTIAKQMTKLQVFVYVSTAFSNCIHSNVEEKIYEPAIDPDMFLKLIDGSNDQILDDITPRLLDRYPNTYVFSKNIAESLVAREMNNLPIAIVRPAIIANTVREPMAGWIDNFYGVVGICVAAALGVLRTLHAKPLSRAYIVPCDFVANLVLAVTWYTACHNHHPLVYNYVGSKTNTMNWRRLMDGVEECGMDYPSEKIVWYYCFGLRSSKLWNDICVFVLHKIPAYLVDFIFLCLRKERIAVKSYRRLDKMLSLISYFTTHDWSFDSDNVEMLYQKMTVKDREVFKFNMDDLDWQQCFRESVKGGRQYLLKDSLETLPQGRRKLWILFICHNILKYCLILLLLWILSIVYKSLIG